jgi:hypothetical protein
MTSGFVRFKYLFPYYHELPGAFDFKSSQILCFPSIFQHVLSIQFISITGSEYTAVLDSHKSKADMTTILNCRRTAPPFEVVPRALNLRHFLLALLHPPTIVCSRFTMSRAAVRPLAAKTT